MDFIKSVFSDEPDQSDLTNSPNSKPISETPKPPIEPQHPNQEQPTLQDPNPNPNPNPKSQSSDEPEGVNGGGVWSFGGLIKTFATKSETVIQTYRRDLEEFGSGLKKETEAIREAAGRVAKELPSSIEVAQGSIESVWRGTTEIIAQSKESILADLEADSTSNSPQQIVNSLSKKYSRFDVQVIAIQGDSSTYSEEPEDVEDYRKWKLGFGVGELEEKGEDMENLLTENAAMDGIYAKLVPSVVDHETFWCRYFYRVFKLKQVEDARANLVKRAISGEEENLSWDVDDDENSVVESKGNSKEEEVKKKESPEAVIKKKEPGVVGGGIESKTSQVVESVSEDKKLELDKNVEVSEVKSEEAVKESDEKAMQATHSDKLVESVKGGVAGGSVGTSQVMVPEEEDVGWDEIEDLGSGDEKKVVSGGSPRRSDLRKRLSVAEEEEEEDLNWDIEDDDEPVKKTHSCRCMRNACKIWLGSNI